MELENLVVKISANISDLKKGFADAERSADSSMGRIAGIVSKMGPMVAAAAAAAGGGMLAMAKNAIDAADNIRDLSLQTGFSVKSLSLWSLAAKQSGTSIEAVAMSGKFLSSAMLEAAAGTGKSASAFAALGVSIKNSDGSLKSMDAIMVDVAAGLNKMEDGARKNVIVTELLGRGGVQLQPFIKAMADGTARAESLGMAISEEFADAADKFNDHLGESESRIGLLGRAIAEGTLPALNKIMTAFSDTGGGAELLKFGVEALAFSLKILASGAAVAIGVLSSLWEMLSSVARAALAAATGEWSKAWDILNTGYKDATAAITQSVNRIQTIWDDTVKKAPATAKGMTTPMAELAKESKKTAEAHNKNINGMRGGVERFSKDAIAALKRLDEAHNKSEIEAVNFLENYATTTTKTTNLLAAEWEIMGGVIADVVNDSKVELNDFERHYNDVMKSFSEIGINTWTAFSRGFGDTMAAVLIDGASFKESISKIFEDIGKRIISMIAQVAAEWAFMKFVMGQDVTFGGVAQQVTGIGGGAPGMGGGLPMNMAGASLLGGNFGAGWAAGQAGGFGAVGQLAGNAPLSTTAGSFMGAAAPWAAGIGLGMTAAQLVGAGEHETSALVGSSIGTLLGGPVGGAIGGALAEPIASFGDSIADVFGWAHGGDVNVAKPTWFLAGEAGPENVRITPLQGGLPESTGGGSQTIIINLDGREIARKTVEHMPGILRMHGVMM